MGIGDELMMAGEALRQAAGTARRYRMLDKHGSPRWHFVWDGNPNIARPGQPFDGEVGYVNRCRPYMVGATQERYTFREYAPEPALIQLSAAALSFAKKTEGAIVFNATIKERASPNKQWPLQYWQQLVSLGREFRWVQIGDRCPAISGAENIYTPVFWDACGALAGADALVLHEGALHHAAAALRRPAVVIRGGFISPKVTGYAGQVDLYVDDPQRPLGCGMRVPCPHCAAAMASIKPEAVLASLRELLKGKAAA